MYNILIGGAAGDGIETMSSLLENILNRNNLWTLTIKDLMSRVRGGHNFNLLRFSNEQIDAHSYDVDLIVALNDETYNLHRNKLKENGYILIDSESKIEDKRALKIDFQGVTKKIGNSKILGTVTIGATLKLFGISTNEASNVIDKTFSKKLAEINKQALFEGYELTKTLFEPIKVNPTENIVVNGNVSIALGALAAGITFYSAYPMSPSTTIMEYLNIKSNEYELLVEQAEDEIAAINMALGASYAGAKAMTASSGGGFCLMVEALGFSGIAEIPIVIADVQRPGPATGLPTRTEQSDLAFVVSASQGEFPRMVISLKNHEDAFYQTKRAFDIAYKYQIPVIILSDQYIADSTKTVPIFDFDKFYKTKPLDLDEIIETDENNVYKRYKYTENGISKMLYPGQSEYLVKSDSDEHDEFGRITENAHVRNAMMEKRMNKQELLKQDLIEPEFFGNENAKTLLISFGSMYGPIKEAINLLNKEGNDYGALVFGDVYPLPTNKLLNYSKTAKNIISVEQNATGQLADLVQKETLLSVKDRILKYDGRQITASEIVKELKSRCV